MNVRKRTMRLIDDFIYILYVITYTIGKKVRDKRNASH